MYLSLQDSQLKIATNTIPMLHAPPKSILKSKKKGGFSNKKVSWGFKHFLQSSDPDYFSERCIIDEKTAKAKVNTIKMRMDYLLELKDRLGLGTTSTPNCSQFSPKVSQEIQKKEEKPPPKISISQVG